MSVETATERPETLADAQSHADSVYIIDYEYRNENGNIKPPCSLSPNYCGCMESRVKELGISGFDYTKKN
jgi:hypothetical protein